MKISEWLTDLDSHGIYDHEKLAAGFLEATGQKPTWPSHTARQTAQSIERRGLGGTFEYIPGVRSAYGWEIAESLATSYAKWPGHFAMGRGRRFHAALDALRAANL